MNHAGDQFLARSGFAGDKHRNFMAGNKAHPFQNLAQSPLGSDKFGIAGAARQRHFQACILPLYRSMRRLQLKVFSIIAERNAQHGAQGIKKLTLAGSKRLVHKTGKMAFPNHAVIVPQYKIIPRQRHETVA